MIRPINNFIEKYLRAYLYRKRDVIIIEAVNRFKDDYPQATELQVGTLKTKLMYEKTRVSPIVDGHLKATIIRAQRTFWFAVLCNLMTFLVGVFFSGHFFAIFTPLINAFIAWNSATWLTIDAADEQRFIAAMNSTITIFVFDTGLQKNPSNSLLIAEAIAAPPPEEPIAIVIDNGERDSFPRADSPPMSVVNHSIFLPRPKESLYHYDEFPFPYP